MPGIHWCDYTTPEDISKDAAACLWWWAEMGDREPMRDFVSRMSRYAGSEASEGERWFNCPSEGTMGDMAAEAMAGLEDGKTDDAFDLLSGFATKVPAGFDLNAFLRQSARLRDYWGELPEDVIDGHSEGETEVV